MFSDAETILLIEDDDNDILLVRRALEKARLVNSLQVVSDGEEAVAYLSGAGKYADRRRYPLPALVLLDLKLPRRSGFEVLAWLRKQPGLKRTRVVVLTSSRNGTDVNRAYELGANSYLVKPVRFEDLVDLLKMVHLYWMVVSERPEVAP